MSANQIVTYSMIYHRTIEDNMSNAASPVDHAKVGQLIYSMSLYKAKSVWASIHRVTSSIIKTI